jgi:hypothetical protein
MREARCRLACQDDLRYVIISLRLCQEFIFMLMLFRVSGHVMGHLGLFVFWVWACPPCIIPPGTALPCFIKYIAVKVLVFIKDYQAQV